MPFNSQNSAAVISTRVDGGESISRGARDLDSGVGSNRAGSGFTKQVL